MNHRTFVIAEAGVNHNGDFERALALAETAHLCGADAVKYQTFRAERLATARATTCSYQEKAIGGLQHQRDMLRGLELPEDAYCRLAQHCAGLGIEFMSTAFDPESLAFLVGETGLKRVKIPSGEMVNPLLLLAGARSGLPVILSTGMATLEEVRRSLAVLAFGLLTSRGLPRPEELDEVLTSAEGRSALRRAITLMHCVSEYPAPPEDANLRAMGTMRDVFGLPVGLSDHTVGQAVALGAVALGADMLEKHFTLDKDLPGPDHGASLAPEELQSLVAGTRALEVALGDGIKSPRPSESRNTIAVRGSLVAAAPIMKGDRLGEANITVKRPGTGLTPMALLALDGGVATRNYAPDDPIIL